MKKTSTILVVLAALSMALTACNTVQGAGKDISSAGKATENAAEDAKH